MFDLLDKLSLVLLDSTLDFGHGEQRIEDLEGSEHLIGRLSLREPSPEDSSNLSDYSFNPHIVHAKGPLKQLIALLTHIKYFYLVE